MSVVHEYSKTYKPLFTTSARYILLWGGRGRGGSFTATQYFHDLVTRPAYFRGYFMREIFGDIRESLWRDFKDRCEENTSMPEKSIDINETSMLAHCRTTGNYIMSKGFKKSSGKRTAKLKSLAGATHVVIEEAEEIDEDDFMQLDDTLRSSKAQIQIILIFNPPPKNHWIWKRWFILIDAPVKGYFRAIAKERADLLSIFATYLDNVASLNESTIANWKAYKQTKEEHYWTVIMGLISEGARGRIFRNWKPCQAMPNTYRKMYGLDWGFSGPLALVEIEVHNMTMWIKQLIYEPGMLNDALDRRLQELGVSKRAPIVADSAQPKDIEEMRGKGWNFIPAAKGPGSINSTIKFIKKYTTYLTEDSRETWLEFENYAWALDQHKEPTDMPVDKWNHAMDAIGYALDTIRRPTGVGFIKPINPKERVAENGRSDYNM